MRILNLNETVALRAPGNLHAALIMDGNRRWAESRGIEVAEAHRHSAPAVAAAIYEAHRLGIRFLTLYCFSSENWKRNPLELRSLLQFQDWLWPATVLEALETVRAQVHIAGEISDPRLANVNFEEVLSHSSDPSEVTITFAVNYGGRQELERAAAGSSASGPLSDNFYLPELPDIDLLLRTSGELRLSNFMLWQAAYAELVFTDTLWPDFRSVHLASAVNEYINRTRKLGA